MHGDAERIESPAPRLDRAALAVAGLFLVAMLPLGASLWRVAPGWVPTGDSAIIVLRSRDVLTSRTPLVGMPTTASEIAGRETHHPGPLEFWVLAAASAIKDAPTTPLFAMAVMNCLWFGAAVFWAWRAGGSSAALLAAAVTAALGWSLRGDVLVDPFNPYAAFPAFCAFLVTAAVALSGERWALPFAALAGSFAAQSHLILAPAVGAVAVGSAAVGMVALRRDFRSKSRPWRKPLAVTAVVLTACWWPVVVDQLWGRGNASALISVTTGSGSTAGWRATWSVLANSVSVPPVWLRDNAGSYALLVGATPLRQVIAVAVLVAATALAVAWRRRRPKIAATLFVALAALASGSYAVTRVPRVFYNIFALHNYLWLWGASALLWAGLLCAAAEASRAEWPRLVRPVAVLVLLLPLSLAANAVVTPSARDTGPRLLRAANTLAELLPDRLQPGAPYVVDLRSDFDGGSVTSALVLILERHGLEVRVPSAAAPSFGRHRTVGSERVAGTLMVAVGLELPQPPTPDSKLLVSVTPEPAARRELDQSRSAIISRIRAAGGLTLRQPPEHLGLAEAEAVVGDGSIRNLVLFGRVADPPLPLAELDRLLRADSGPVRYVQVYLAPGGG